MAPKIAASFTVAEVTANQPRMERERETGEILVHVCERESERILVTITPQLLSTRRCPPITTEACHQNVHTNKDKHPHTHTQGGRDAAGGGGGEEEGRSQRV